MHACMQIPVDQYDTHAHMGRIADFVKKTLPLLDTPYAPMSPALFATSMYDTENAPRARYRHLLVIELWMCFNFV